MSRQKKILLLGPLRKEAEPEGGTTVSFAIFLKELTKNDINFEVINTNKISYKYKVLALLKIYILFFIKLRKHSHISLHGTDKDYIYLAVSIVFFSKLFGKTVSLRKFAGSFLDTFQNLNMFQQVLVKYALRNSNINLFQTKYLVNYFEKYNSNTIWFPTVRTKPNLENDILYKKRFIFLGHIRAEKGIDEILNVSNLLDASYHIDLYGSIAEEKYHKIDWKKYKNISYKGVLNPLDVYAVLSKYDILLLPSYWKGEGYPGVIIESFALGIPVIATNLLGISEIVNSDSGILIEAKNVEELMNAILFFNEKNYIDFSKSALKNFKQFDAEIETGKIIDKIKI